MSRTDIEMFWMVYGAGCGAPAVRHKTFESADNEATRLARSNPGTRFYVLEPVSTSLKRDVETVRLRPGKDTDDDIPF